MITIKDIARETGLSPATVARALNGETRTRQETRHRVREAADRLGYVANNAARMMRGQAAHTIGLIVPDIVNSFYATMAKAMAEVCEHADHQLVLAVTEDDPAREARQMRAMVAARAGAVALVPSRAPTAETVELAARQPFAQLVRQAPRIGSAWFGFDEEAAIAAATRHLLDLGHRRILIVCGAAPYSTGVSRLAGYRHALEAAGLPFEPSLVRAGLPDLAHGRSALEELPDDVTAIIAAGVHLTEGVVEAIEDRGLAVPDDLSVVGFGNAAWMGWWRDGMTRIELPVREIVLNCGTNLIRRARDGERSDGGRVTHATRLVTGATTDRPRRIARAAKPGRAPGSAAVD